jgi:hypothetical protein
VVERLRDFALRFRLRIVDLARDADEAVAAAAEADVAAAALLPYLQHQPS